MQIPAVFFLGFWFLQQFLLGALSLAQGPSQMGGVAWWAHIGGFVAGIVLVGLFQDSRRHPPAREQWWTDGRYRRGRSATW